MLKGKIIMKVGIIGAGPAGVTAAQTIAKEGIEVTLFSAEKVLPYHRPRLPEFAFGDERHDNVFMYKFAWYAENGIDLRLNSKVKSFNSNFEVILKNGKQEKFNALVIATGASPVVLPCMDENKPENVFTLWNYSDALEIRKRLKSTKHIAIIGGGLIGVESALRAADNDLNITMIEKAPHLMSRYFGEKASRIIEAKLHERNIDFVLNNTVCKNSETKHFIELDLEDKDSFICDFVILTVGSGFDTKMAAEAGLKTDLQIVVDNCLQTSSPGIFAAGDIAQLPILRPCSGKEAVQQGKAVGNNVLAYLNGKELQSYKVEPVPILLKYKDFEAYSIGEIPQIDREENVLDCDQMKTYRGCVYENTALAGVQMVGTDKDFSKLQKELLLSDVWKLLNHKLFLV
jgi:NAD(P)H-nitrite reductase large subunit